MAVPLIATWRMHIIYQVLGLVHELNMYCDADLVSGSYVINLLAGGTCTVQQAADGFGAGFVPMYRDTDITSCVALLQQKSGFNWLTRDTKTVNGTPATTGTTVLASQNTLVLRDLPGNVAKIIALETTVPLPFHITSPGSIPARLIDFYNVYSKDSGSGTYRPALWMVSRGDNALQDEPLIGATGDFNDKVRRARGLV